MANAIDSFEYSLETTNVKLDVTYNKIPKFYDIKIGLVFRHASSFFR